MSPHRTLLIVDRPEGTKLPRVYVAGPMTGKPAYNLAEFTAAAARLRNQGWDPVTPFEANNRVWRAKYDRDFDPYTDKCDWGDPLLAKMFLADIETLFDAEAVALLDGWRNSKGATAEALLAQRFGKLVFEESTRRRVPTIDLLLPAEGLEPTAYEPPVAVPQADGAETVSCQVIEDLLEVRQMFNDPSRHTFPDYIKRDVDAVIEQASKATNPTGGHAGVNGALAGNPKDAIGSTKLPLHLWPETATALGALGLLEGALKYGRNNYRAIGVRATIYADALQRHLKKWFEGEDFDEDSELDHWAHILACAAIVVDARAAGKLIDDRNFPGGFLQQLKELTPHVARLKAKHAEKNPEHFTITSKAG